MPPITRCIICGTEFTCGTSGNRPRKTCNAACRKILRAANGEVQSKNQSNDKDPTPDEIIRRARIIREINERNKKDERGRPRIEVSELDWW